MSTIFWWVIAVILICICLVAFLLLRALGDIAKSTDEDEERRSRKYFDR